MRLTVQGRCDDAESRALGAAAQICVAHPGARETCGEERPECVVRQRGQKGSWTPQASQADSNVEGRPSCDRFSGEL
jgi:hypothetical protein